MSASELIFARSLTATFRRSLPFISVSLIPSPEMIVEVLTMRLQSFAFVVAVKHAGLFRRFAGYSITPRTVPRSADSGQ